MTKRFSILILLVVCFIVLDARVAFSETVLSPVAGTNNQIQINNALKKGGTVFLKAGTYIIDSNIEMVSGTSLLGERGAKVMVVSDAKWKKFRPIIRFLHVENARVAGFEIDGNRDNNIFPYPSAAEAMGHQYYRIFYLYKSKNIEIDKMYLHDNWDDVVFSEKTWDLNFHDNVIRRPGHDVVTTYHSGTTFVTNNCMRVYGNVGVRNWDARDDALYAISNDIAREAYAPSYAGIASRGRNSIVHDCNNNIHDIPTPYGISSGGRILPGGCPISAAASLATSSCNPSSLESVKSSGGCPGGSGNSGGSSTSGTDDASGSVGGNDSSSDTDTASDDTPVSIPADLHIIGGFRAKSETEMAALAKAGGNVVMNYNSIGSLESMHKRLVIYTNRAAKYNLKMIDDIPHTLISQFHKDWDLDKAVTMLTAHMKWLAANDDVRSRIVGYWMIDDWDTDFGKAKVALQKMTGLVRKYTPGKYAICGVQGNSGWAGDVAKYQARFTLNYSPEGCDMIGVYMYPYGAGKTPMKNIANVLQAFRNVGWSNESRPLVGISQSYGGQYGYYVPTAAQVEAETKYFCQLGAKHIMWFDFNMGTGNGGNNAGVQAGIKAGVKACRAIWGD
jgi:hypothetical protein